MVAKIVFVDIDEWSNRIIMLHYSIIYIINHSNQKNENIFVDNIISFTTIK